MTRLSQAILMATEAHDGQLDKGGQAYILHPLAVMQGMGLDASEDERIVAVLHDVVEDTSITLERVRAVFGDVVTGAVDALTRRPQDDYEFYSYFVARNPISRAVKIQDLIHNLRTDRVPGHMFLQVVPLWQRYKKALAFLQNVTPSGAGAPFPLTLPVKNSGNPGLKP